MRLFECDTCGSLLYFENTRCETCGAALAFDPHVLRLRSPDGGDALCANAAHGACNWLAEPGQAFCRACRLNRTIPDLTADAHVVLWRRLETAKHRAVYSLMRLGLPLTPKTESPEAGLAFDFLADPDPEFREVMTGHAGGVVTINIAEADPVERERQRDTMAEPFRTLLGHFRHEVGHWVWDLRVKDGPALAEFRTLFGDETADYAQALQAHYDAPDDGAWRGGFISRYAASHPWEDWAECFAHYLHMVDALETAYAFGLRSRPRAGGDGARLAADFDPYAEQELDRILEAWVPLTVAVNSLNRSMGQADLYPFVLSDAVVAKLGFVHRIVRAESL
ncbi:hypothetical protein C882_4023 [Caenispirillum salinarum AK4]|uniref:Zinc-ribbon domain-containing protein n=1 Tax=Caenispirillum salinarum AK4 TaxID=1238182 RepID=K9HQL4_9PROT|nr:putative zinc-binding metallopeptidase [Caenispirillum salinarum]EKV30686.1 hypothetical protein C882_4023 [Caenispirillum salinarum AK4]